MRIKKGSKNIEKARSVSTTAFVFDHQTKKPAIRNWPLTTVSLIFQNFSLLEISFRVLMKQLEHDNNYFKAKPRNHEMGFKSLINYETRSFSTTAFVLDPPPLMTKPNAS